MMDSKGHQAVEVAAKSAQRANRLNGSPVSAEPALETVQFSPIAVQEEGSRPESVEVLASERDTEPLASKQSTNLIEILFSILVMIGTGILLGVLWFSKGELPASEKKVAIPQVEVGPVNIHKGPVQFTVNGSVVPYRELQIATEVSGRILKLGSGLRVGSKVRKDELLVQIDPTDYQLEVDRLKIQLLQDRSSLRELTAELARNRNEYSSEKQTLEVRNRAVDRFKKMSVAGNVNPFSQVELDQAVLNVLSSKKSLQSLDDNKTILDAKIESKKISIELTGQQLRKAELQLRRTKIVSPVDGVITKLNFEEDGFSSAGSALVSIQDLAKMEVRCHLKKSQLNWLWENGIGSLGEPQVVDSNVEMTVMLQEFNGFSKWKAESMRVDGGGLDPITRTLPVRLVVTRPQNGVSSRGVENMELVKGMFVQVLFEKHSHKRLLEIPASAVNIGGVVWEVVDSRLVKHQVKVVQSKKGIAVISPTGDLTDQSVIVTSPIYIPQEGMRVQVEFGGEK